MLMQPCQFATVVLMSVEFCETIERRSYLQVTRIDPYADMSTESRITSIGSTKFGGAENGHELELRTMMEKSTETYRERSDSDKCSRRSTDIIEFFLLAIAAILFDQILAHTDVLEHALQFRRVLETTRLLQKTYRCKHPHSARSSYLQLRDHRLFVVVGRAQLSDQSLRQHLPVELLEHVLVFDIVEHHLTDPTTCNRAQCMANEQSHHDLVELLFEIGLFDSFASRERRRSSAGGRDEEDRKSVV